MKSSTIWIIVLLVIAALIFFGIRASRTAAAPYQEFAQCITDAGTTYYAAWWCPNCQNQKAMFKGGAKYLPEVECAEANRQQNEVCSAAGIEAYPTWELNDGTRTSGVLEFEELAVLTDCELPESLGGPILPEEEASILDGIRLDLPDTSDTVTDETPLDEEAAVTPAQ